MKILFINPASYNSSFYRNQYFPLGIGYIASSCLNNKHDVDVLDLGIIDYSLKEIIDYVNNFNPDYCSFTLYTVNLLNTYKIIDEVKSKCKCKIIVGGPHATILPQKTLLECQSIDYLVKGEGEITIIELLGDVEINSIKGLYYRNKKEILSNSLRPFINDLNTIHFPERKLFEKYNYSYDEIRLSTSVAPIIAGRGCPYNCVFCASKAVWGTSFRIRSPENVIEEIEEIVKNGTTEFYFEDDLFTHNPNWINHFCNLIISKKLKITWKALSRVDSITNNELKLMKKAGCHTVQFGVESGSNEILKSIHKKITKNKVRNAFKLARNSGLNTHAFFMFGHSQDTHETIKETIKFAKELNSDFISFFVGVPFPGTQNYELLSEIDKYDWSKFAYYHDNIKPLCIGNISANDLLKYEKKVYINYFLRIGYLKNIISFRPLNNLKIKSILINILELLPPHIKNTIKYLYNKLKK